MKTKEELNALKNEVEALNAKLGELTEEEMEQVTGGETWWPVEQKQPTGAEAVGAKWEFAYGYDIPDRKSYAAEKERRT